MKPISRDVVFALEFNGDAPALTLNVVSLAWTADVARVLKQIRDEASAKARRENDRSYINLPYARLRAQLHLQVDDWISCDDDVGLRKFSDSTSDPASWGLLDPASYEEKVRRVRDAFAHWIEGPLAQFCEGRGAYTIGIQTLRKLCQDNAVVCVASSQVKILPWSGIYEWGKLSPYDVTAGLIASNLEGKELFPDLGPVVRVMAGASRNKAEVMTRPILLPGAGGMFSLVCQISLETVPGSRHPIVYLRFVRRLWANGVKQGYVSGNSIGAFVFPHSERPQKAYRFSLNRTKDKKWETDLGYRQYEHAFGLTEGYHDDQVLNYPCNETASVVVMLKPDMTELEDSELKAGVPLVDQADAFFRIAHQLSSLGLRPFESFMLEKPAKHKTPPLSLLKAEVLLGALLDRHASGDDEKRPVDDIVADATLLPSSRWYKTSPKPNVEHDRICAAIRQLVDATSFGASAGRNVLYFVSHTPDDIEWVKTMAASMFGDKIKVLSVPLPANVHGLKDELPGNTLGGKARLEMRIAEWLTFAQSIGLPKKAMLLIQAPKFYERGGKSLHEDRINKAAARKALAGHGCTVQYLLPSKQGRLNEFIPRIQASLIDLVVGHSGSIWGMQHACGASFKDEGRAPKFVGAVTSLQVSTIFNTWQSVLVATKLECATGTAWVRFGHQESELVITDWMSMDDGMHYLAARAVALPAKAVSLREFTSNFFVRTFDEFSEIDPGALIFLDSTRGAKLASWLTDQKLRDEDRHIATGVTISKQWPLLRLIRVREQAPVIGQEKHFGKSLQHENQEVRTWTSVDRLFRVESASVPTFWSLSKARTHHKRGASCYREILLPVDKPTEQRPGPHAMYPAVPYDQSLTPRAVEFALLQKQSGDSDIELATLAQNLRRGLLTARNEVWLTSPAPLRIVEKLRQYMQA